MRYGTTGISPPDKSTPAARPARNAKGLSETAWLPKGSAAGATAGINLNPPEDTLMRSTRFIPMAVLALAVACSENASNPVDNNGPSFQNVHLKGGANAEPTFFDAGLFLQSSGALTGLGSGNITVELSATGNPTATCTNPAGATQPPGQNPAQVTLTGVQEIPEGSIKNGNVTFNVQTASPVSPVPGAPACPNPNWTETITDVAFTSAIITVRQPSTAANLGPVVLTVTCTFTTPTPNGAVPGGNVSCTQS